MLSDILDIKKGITAIIGSGGKTTLMIKLAKELSQKGKVIICTTTHIYPCLLYTSMCIRDRNNPYSSAYKLFAYNKKSDNTEIYKCSRRGC